MKVAIVSNPRHRAGDMIEYLLLRAVHAFNKFVPADLLIVEGELGEPEEGFLKDLFLSVERRRLPLAPLWLVRQEGAALPEAPEQVDVNGVPESVRGGAGRCRRRRLDPGGTGADGG